MALRIAVDMLGHVTHINATCHTHGKVMSRTWMSHVAHMNATPIYVLPRRRTRARACSSTHGHVRHIDGSGHVAQINPSYWAHAWEKVACIYEKETYIYAKETYIYAKETCKREALRASIISRTWMRKSGLHIRKRDLYIRKRDLYMNETLAHLFPVTSHL